MDKNNNHNNNNSNKINRRDFFKLAGARDTRIGSRAVWLLR